MNTHMEFFKNASGVNIGNMNNQSFDNSYVERITNGWSSDNGGPNGSGNSSGRQSWQAAHQPSTPSSTCGAIPTLTGPSISPNSSNEASSALLCPPSHTRPGPVPIQEAPPATQHVAGTPSRTRTPEPHQSVPAPPNPVSPPKYTIGVLRAVDAQAHLTQKTLGSIGKLLRDTRRSITTNRWTAQVGFMHDRQEFRDVFNRDALYTSHNQIIIVTVFASRSISQKAGDDVAERLSVLLGGFYGLLVWKRTVSVMRPARAHKVGKDVALFGEESGVSLDGTFGSPSFESAEDSVCVKASNCTPGHPSYFYTEVRYQPKEVSGLVGPQTVVVQELAFKGPEEYELQQASTQVIADVPSDFRVVQPHQRGLVQSLGQYKQTVMDTSREAQTGSVGIEASQSGAKVTGNLSMTTGKDHTKSTDTMRNGLSVSHFSESLSATIKYAPAHPEHDRTQLVILGDDLPKVTICASSGESRLEVVKIRTLSMWKAKQPTVKVPGLIKRLPAYLGVTERGRILQYRKDADVIFCTEVAVLRGTHGLNSVSPRMDVLL